MESRRNRNQQNESHLDQLNQTMAENLSSKVGQLKGLAIDLDSECKDHIPLLDDLDDDIETGSSRMTSTTNRIRSVGGGGGGGSGSRRGSALGILGRCSLSLYVAVFVTLFLLFVYYFILHQKP